MVQKTFSIYSEITQQCCLFIEAGTTHIACWCSPEQGNVLLSFELFQFQADKRSFNEIFNEVLLHSSLLNQTYDAVKLIWENEACVCVPASLFNEASAKNYLDVVAGECFSNNGINWYKVNDIMIVFRTDNESKEVIQKQFPSLVQEHKFGVMLQSLSIEASTTNAINIVFYHTHFIMAVKKQQQLQLVQRFNYHTANEVAYHILNTCQRTGIDLNETTVTISGLIDLSSALYAELYKYILHLQLDTIDESSYNKEAMNEYAPHYFIPFFKNVV